MGVEPTVHLDPVNPDDPMVKEVKYFLDEKNIDDDRISGVHDIRIVNTENHHVILFGMNVKLGLSQKQIIACKEELNRLLKEKFNGYAVSYTHLTLPTIYSV